MGHVLLALNGRTRDAQDIGGIFNGQATEETQFEDAALLFVKPGKLGGSVIGVTKSASRTSGNTAAEWAVPSFVVHLNFTFSDIELRKYTLNDPLQFNVVLLTLLSREMSG